MKKLIIAVLFGLLTVAIAGNATVAFADDNPPPKPVPNGTVMTLEVERLSPAGCLCVSTILHEVAPHPSNLWHVVAVLKAGGGGGGAEVGDFIGMRRVNPRSPGEKDYGPRTVGQVLDIMDVGGVTMVKIKVMRKMKIRR